MGKESESKSEAAAELGKQLDRYAVDVQRTTTGALVTTCIGFDFGTSSTKIVIGLPTMADKPMFPVRWRDVAAPHEVDSYLLPSEISFDGSAFRLEPSPEAFRYRRLKQALLEPEHVPPPPEGLPSQLIATVAFIALALRGARRWFFAKAWEGLGKRKHDWSLLVGIPAENADRFAQAADYRRIVRAAWLASVMPGEVTPAMVQRALDHSEEIVEREGPWGCVAGIVPEVAAEVFGYGSSPHRRDGVHLMIDVGAGTVDVCAFIFPPSKPAPHFLTAEVRPYGAQRLHELRCRQLRRATTARLQRLADTFDPLKPLPQRDADYLAPDEDARTLEGVHADLVAKVVMCVGGVVAALRRNRDPHSPVWSGWLPTFLCGGGGLVPVYKHALAGASTACKKLVSNPHFQGLEVQSLPCPASVLHAVGEAGFHRLAVAWGLARQPPENIGDIRGPSEIDDIPEGGEPPTGAGNGYVGPEQV